LFQEAGGGGQALGPDGGAHGTGGDRVEADAARAVADGQILGQVDQAGLGRAVGLVAERGQAVHGADADHVRVAGGPQEQRQRGLDAQEGRRQGGGHVVVELRGGQAVKWRVAGLGCAVDQDVQGGGGLPQRHEQPAGRVRVGHVDRPGGGGPALGGDVRGHPPGGALVPVGHDDLGPGGSEPAADLAADPAPTSGDHHAAARETVLHR
jgi:hypothetical protein